MTTVSDAPAGATMCPVTGLREFSLEPSHDRPMDEPAYFADLRESCPISRVSVGGGAMTAWLFTRFDDVKAVLADTRFSSNPRIAGYPHAGTPGADSPILARSIIRSDAPDHARLRRLTTAAFMPRNVELLKPRIHKIIDDHLDAMEEHGSPADYSELFALPVPSAVISMLLGVPDEDHARFQTLTESLVSKTATNAEQHQIAADFAAYCGELVDLKKREPGDDITTRLLAECDENGRLSRDELIAYLVLLVAAGHDTTWGIFALAVPTLLGVPHELERLRNGEASWDVAVEELVRHHSVVRQGPRRVATEDVMVGDTLVRKGEGVIAAVLSANHDAAVFGPDATAAAFTVPESRRLHVGFGFGPHQCLGQSVARVELTYGLEQLFKRFPNLRIDDPKALSYRFDHAIYGIDSVPVRW